MKKLLIFENQVFVNLLFVAGALVPWVPEA